MRGVGLSRGRGDLIPSPDACAPTSPPGRGSWAGFAGESGGLVSRRLAAVTVRFAPGGHPARSCSLSRGERVGVRGVELSWGRRSLIPSPDACAPTSPPGRGFWAGFAGESGGLVSRRPVVLTVRFAPGGHPARSCSLSHGERVGVRGVELSWGRRSLIPSPDACAPTSPLGRGAWAGFSEDIGRLVLRRPAAVTVRFAPGVQPARCHPLSRGERVGVRGVELSWIRRSLIRSPVQLARLLPMGKVFGGCRPCDECGGRA